MSDKFFKNLNYILNEDGNQINVAQGLIKHLEKNLQNPLEIFECAYQDIFLLKSIGKENGVKSNQKFIKYKVQNADSVDILTSQINEQQQLYKPQDTMTVIKRRKHSDANSISDENTQSSSEESCDDEDSNHSSLSSKNSFSKSEISSSLSKIEEEQGIEGENDLKEDEKEDFFQQNSPKTEDEHNEIEDILSIDLLREQSKNLLNNEFSIRISSEDQQNQSTTIQKLHMELNQTSVEYEEKTEDFQVDLLSFTQNQGIQLISKENSEPITRESQGLQLYLRDDLIDRLCLFNNKDKILQNLNFIFKIISEWESELNFFEELDKFYNNHVCASEFYKMDKILFIQNLENVLINFCDHYESEYTKIANTHQLYKETRFIPKEIILQREKLTTLFDFFDKQLKCLLHKIEKEQLNLSQQLFLIFLFAKSLSFEIDLYQKQLPSYVTKSQIQFNIYDNKTSQVYLLTGETGSGKTTQVPQMLFALNNFYLSGDYLYQKSSKNLIICVQPRRIACINLYQRVKFEMNEFDHQVGYYVGNLSSQQNYKGSQIIFVTEQVFINLFVDFLKNQKGNSQSLISQCSHIIVDEVHERNLRTDIIIGLINKYIKDNMEKNNINFLLSSATINQEHFNQYFLKIGLTNIEIIGRSYPVKVEYLDNSEQFLSLKEKVINQIEKIIDLNASEQENRAELQGHILIFLSDQIEINIMMEDAYKLLQLKPYLQKQYEILQLHGKLNQKEQQKVFEENQDITKIIFATNIAEASITIENVSIVIDTGLEKTMIFDPNRNSNVIKIQDISKSQAEQRKGRAGRTRFGICYRLYTEQQFKEFKQDKEPEIVKSNLGFVILKIIELGIQNISEFEFLSKPSESLIQNSMDTLEALGAIIIKDCKCTLTDIGKCIIQTQLEPLVARIFIKASFLGVVDEVIKAMAVYAEYGNIFGGSKNNRDFIKKIQQDYEKYQGNQSNRQSGEENKNLSQINENNSDFIFLWITFEYLRKQNDMMRAQKIQYNNFIKNSFKRIEEYYKDAKQAVDNLHRYIMKHRDYFLKKCQNKEIQGIGIALVDNKLTKVLKPQQRNENIVLSFFSGFSRQVAIYTGIHKLGFLNIQSNIMFYVHPSSSLNAVQTNKLMNRVFQKGEIVFFSILEEREVNNFARFVSFLKREWIEDQQTIQKIEDKSNFQPFIRLNGEKPLLDYFSRNEFVTLSQNLTNYNKNNNASKKAKYCVFFEKELGRIQFYCNPDMQSYMESLNIDMIFQESKEKYLRDLKSEKKIIRYKDSFNFAIVKNGLYIQQLVLPHQFLQVNILNIPFKSNENNILNLLNTIQDPKQRKYSELKIIYDYINKTTQAEFRFKSTKSAEAFYNVFSKIDKNKAARLLGAEPSQIPKLVPVSECSYYIETIKNLSKCIVRAQWSVSPSLCYGQIYFSNEVDMLGTYDNLKKAKQFKVKFDAKDDTVGNNTIHIIFVEKLHPFLDEIDLEQYIVNSYQGFLSCQIKREQMDASFYRNIGLEENNQKRNLLNLISNTISQIKNNKNSKNGNDKDNLVESLRIQNGVCKAEIMLDSTVQAQQLVDRFDGIEFGYQKLRLQIQNQQKILILGAVYKLYYEDIQQYIIEAAQGVKVKAPKLSEITFLSKNIQILIKQVNQDAIHIFHRLQFQIKNIIKPELMYLDCIPEDLDKVMEKQHKVIFALERECNCVLKQSSKRRSELKIWFRANSTQKHIQNSKKKIKQELNEYLLQKLHIQKQYYIFKNVDMYLQKMQKAKNIDYYEFDNKKITIRATNSKLMDIKKELNNPSNNYLISAAPKTEEDTCQICQEVKNLERFSCDCLFCKDCIYSFFLTQSQLQRNVKPLACPNHQDQPVSLKLISSIFDSQQLAELIQLRIENSIENFQDPVYQKQAYIRCPSVNCNQFFQRIYPQSQEDSQDMSFVQSTTDEIPFEKANSQQIGQIQLNEQYGVPPTKVKCYGCFQEYCLLSSSKYFDRPEYSIHHTHIQKTCEEYFKHLQIEQENIKGVNIIVCPRCKLKATKGEGCNHITCKCGAHFCAKCTKQFDSPQDVYKHLQEVHQGMYD